jgi:hypothetical protein
MGHRHIKGGSEATYDSLLKRHHTGGNAIGDEKKKDDELNAVFWGGITA